MPYIIIGVFVLGLIAYYFFKQKNKPVTQDYFISAQGESEERVKKLNLDNASENVSHILDVKKLSFPKIVKETGKIEYKPDTEKDWIINIKTLNPTSFTKEELWNLFDKDWRVNFGAADIYGYSPEEKRWTYVIAGGTPEIYDKVQVAIDLVEIFDEENPSYDTKKLEKYVSELRKKIKNCSKKLDIEFTETIEQALLKGKQLAELKHEFDIEAIILLKSEKTFKGKLAWDALQRVGLVWGDGDLFHWNNEENYGHDQHFSVWTTTEPGYFLPEDIKDGNMNPTDLGFSFSVPRSADPKNVFAMMLDAVKYCQSRLGGTILDKDGNLFNEAKEKKYLDDLIERMKKKGLIAGSDKALRMF